MTNESEPPAPSEAALAFAAGTLAVRCCCPSHPDERLERFGTLARCFRCGDAVELCGDTFGRKECVRRKGHEGADGQRPPSTRARDDFLSIALARSYRVAKLLVWAGRTGPGKTTP